MHVTTDDHQRLRFTDGSPVRAASAVAAFGDGWLIAQDDATHAAWLRPGDRVDPVRVLPAIDGHETFSSAEGTKHLKPDFEAACPIGGAVLLLGSGSSPARMRASLVTSPSAYAVADLSPLYREVAQALGIAVDRLNLEGACVVGDRLRWFQRGNSAAGVPSASVDVDLAALLSAVHACAGALLPSGHAGAGTLLAAVHAEAGAGAVWLGDVRRYDLGTVAGVALAVTDAVALPDGRVLVSAAAEDTPNAIDDGPVVGAAVAVLADDRAVRVAALPQPDKIEGLALRSCDADGASLLAVVDADDPLVPSAALGLRVSW